MGFTAALPHALGRDARYYAQAESTRGTFVRATGGGAFKAKKFGISYDIAREYRTDNRASRSEYEQFTGKEKVDWEIEGYLIPSGSAGTAPDMGEIFQALMGSETVTPATSVAYGLNNTQSGRQTLSMTRYMSVFMDQLRGSIVTSGKISGKGSDPFMCSFKGRAEGATITGNSTLDGAVTASATNVVEAVDQYSFEGHATHGSIVMVGANDNTNTGYMVTGRSGATLTLEATLTAADAADVLPFAPAETVSGSPIGGIVGSLSLDSVSIPITGFEVEIDNQDVIIEDEVGQPGMTDAIPGMRKISGSFDVRIRRDQVRILGHRKNSNFTTRAVSIVIGSTAGRICTVSMPQIEVTFSSPEVPDGSDSVTCNIPFRALASSGSATDEISIVFT